MDEWMILEIRTERSKRGAPRILVVLTNGQSLALAPDLVVVHKLALGKGVGGEAGWSRLAAEQARWDARSRLIGYLATRKKSRREAEAYLVRLGFPDDAVDYATQAAQELGYLNDTEYAGAFARTQSRTTKKGPRAVEMELRARGVDAKTACDAVAPFRQRDDQLERATELAEARWRILKKDPEDARKARQKLQRWLLGRGYDGEICAEAVRKVTGKPSDDEFDE